MAVARIFPMIDGPPIPYALAQVIWEAYARLHGESNNLGKIAERGGFAWAEVPLIFGQVKKKDREYHKGLLYRARNLVLEEEDIAQIEARNEVQSALNAAEAQPMPDLPLPPAPSTDPWEENVGNVMKIAPVIPKNNPLTIVCWKWTQANYKTVFHGEHVNVLTRMFRRHLKIPHRVVCITDNPKGITECDTFPLWNDHCDIPNISGKHLPSCYRRLKIFDTEVAKQLGANRIVSVDLDIVVTGTIDHLFERPDPFVGWKVPGVHVAEVYNGSMFMFTVGPYEWIWKTFDPNKSPFLAKAAGYQGSDQGWISYCLKAREPGWGRHDGVMSYPREVRNAMGLPNMARLVIFHGQRKPWDQRYSRDRQWITKHYR